MSIRRSGSVGIGRAGRELGAQQQARCNVNSCRQMAPGMNKLAGGTGDATISAGMTKPSKGSGSPANYRAN